MNLHEYQSKNLFARFNIPTPKGKIATSPQEAFDYAKELGGAVVVKAQVLTSGRGAAGGIMVARTPDQALAIAESILGMEIKGLTVHKVLIDPLTSITQELYLAITYDRSREQARIQAAGEKKSHAETVVQEYIDPFIGLRDYQVRNLVLGIELPRESWRAFNEIAHGLYNCFHDCDATLCEINPLALTSTHTLLALDGKIIIDDSALFRHPDLAEMRDLQAEPTEEMRAREAGLQYVKLDGDIGLMVNGAGLAMATMDVTRDIAARLGFEDSGPANFMDIGGARADKVAAALRIILTDPKVKAVLCNIFGGITRCDEVARGILQAMTELKTNVPFVVRLAGTNADEGRRMIDEAHLPNISSAISIVEAAEKALRAARKAQRVSTR